MSGEAATSLVADAQRELRQLARRLMAREPAGHTLQATALVNEMFLRLRGQLAAVGSDPRSLHLAAAAAMRRILVEHARRRGRQRRGGDLQRLPLDLTEVADRMSERQLDDIDEAIAALARQSERAAAIVRLRFFAGMDEAEVAEVLRLSPRTVRRDWAFARAWLYRELSDPAG